MSGTDVLSPPTIAALTVTGATVRFGGIIALNDVSIEVGGGQVVGLVGPNGAGKTTLFGVASGFVRPTAGRVNIAGQDVTSMRPEVRARCGLGRTFQRPRLYVGLSVRDHLCLAYRLRSSRRRLWTDLIRPNSTPAAARDERAAVDRLLELLNLSSVADEEVSRLSLGAQRLVEVGRALAFRPTVILLDEPSSGLDSRETANLANTLQQTVTSEGVALVLVEHDVGFVLGLASDVYVLDSGALIAHGTGAQIRNDDAVVAAYLGSSGTRPK